MQEVSFSTVQVEPGRLHLNASNSFWKYIVPFDRSDELNQLLDGERDLINELIDQNKDRSHLLKALQENEKQILKARHYSSLERVDKACELIRHELTQGAYRKVVVFGITKDVIEGVRIRLHDFKPVTVYPKSSPIKLEKNIHRFLSEKSPVRVLISGIRSINVLPKLTNTNFVFFVEEYLNTSENARALSKCVKDESDSPLFVRNFCLHNYADVHIQELLRDSLKESLALELLRDPETEDSFADLF